MQTSVPDAVREGRSNRARSLAVPALLVAALGLFGATSTALADASYDPNGNGYYDLDNTNVCGATANSEGWETLVTWDKNGDEATATPAYECWAPLQGNTVNAAGDGFEIAVDTYAPLVVEGELFTQVGNIASIPQAGSSASAEGIIFESQDGWLTGTWEFMSGLAAELAGHNFLIALKGGNQFGLWLFLGDSSDTIDYAGRWEMPPWKAAGPNFQAQALSNVVVYKGGSPGDGPNEVPAPATAYLLLLALGLLRVQRRRS